MSEIKITQGSNEIFYTDDLEIFKRLKGNRSVEWPRVKKIIESIEKVGYISSPIIVNEKMEVIDGQGRVEACAYLELPIAYTIIPGIGLDECISMNIFSGIWKLPDYIASFAETGRKDYQRLMDLLKKHSDVPISIVLTAASGKTGGNNNLVKNGNFKMDEERELIADQTLDYIERFIPFVKDKGIANAQKLYEALCFLYWIDRIDNERMYHAFTKYYAEIGGFSRTEHVLEILERLYNKKLSKGNKVFICSEYREYMSSKLSWYEARYGSNR